MKGKTGMLPLDEMLPKRGWDIEPTDGFQTSDGHEALLTLAFSFSQFWRVERPSSIQL